MSNREMENTLLMILDELRTIRQFIVPAPKMNDVELEQNLTRAMGVGPDDAFNK